MCVARVCAHRERVHGGVHALHVPLERAELLVEGTAAVPQHLGLQDVATAPVSLEQRRVQLHGLVYTEGGRKKENVEKEKRKKGRIERERKKTVSWMISIPNPWFRTLKGGKI